MQCMPHTARLRKKPTKRVNTKHHFKTTKTLKDTRAKASDCKMSKCQNVLFFFFLQCSFSAYDLIFVVKLLRECSFWSEIRTILQLEQAKRVSCGRVASPSLTCSRNQDWIKKPRVADRRGRSAKKSPEEEPPDGRAG